MEVMRLSGMTVGAAKETCGASIPIESGAFGPFAIAW
jgi:hypothetical protein